MIRPNHILALGAALAFLSVALGAFGAHALRDFLLAQNRTDTYQTAVHYQFFHALALMVTGLMARFFPQLPFQRVAICFISGILIFSGSLYLLCATGIKWLGAVTPVGGLAFLTGWALMAGLSLKIK